MLYIVAFAFFALYAVFLLVRLRKMYTHFRLFSYRTDVRALMARDPRRFHVSLVYLMAYMVRSSDDAVQKDKLELIVRYIRVVCPKEIQEDAIQALEYLTVRFNTESKEKQTEVIIDVDAFKNGSDKCIENGTKSFRYKHDLHGKRLAEELALYLSEDDRLYVMYMLYRLAAVDGRITTKGKKSEVYMLHRLCVEGLKIEKEKLDELLRCFTEGTAQAWYDQHFSCKENRYPSSDGIANLFRGEAKSFASFEKQYSQASKDVVYALVASLPVFIVLGLLLSYEHSMGEVYPDWTPFVFFAGAIIVPTISHDLIVKIESCLVPVIRTKKEDALQLRGLILGTVLSLFFIVSVFWGISNSLFVVANEVYRNEKELVISVPVTDTYTTTRSAKRHTVTVNHVSFPEVSLADKQFDTESRRKVSPLNSFCLKTLPLMSGMIFKDMKNTKTMQNMEVDFSVNEETVGRRIKLHFKVGYYGLAYLDGCELE